MITITEYPLYAPSGKTYHLLFRLKCDCGSESYIDGQPRVYQHLKDFVEERIKKAEHYTASYKRDCLGKREWQQRKLDFEAILQGLTENGK